MKMRSFAVKLVAVLTIVAGGWVTQAMQAQTRAAEFPAPQSTGRNGTAGPAEAKPIASGTLGAARAIPFDQMEVRTNPAGGVSRNIAHGSLATGESVNLHQSMQVAGQAAPALHVIQHSEFILVREGELEFDHEVDGKIVAEKAGPGDVFYVAFGTRHAIKNVGNVPAKYFVVAVGGDAR